MSRFLSRPVGLVTVALLACLVGLAVGWRSGSRSDSAATNAPSASALAQAEALLERVARLEERARTSETRNAELRAELTQIAQQLDATASGVEVLLETSAAEVAPTPGAPPPGGNGRAPEPPVRPDFGTQKPDQEVLIGAGFAPDEVDAYFARVADLEMERLYLADRAAREGWIGTDRYSEETEALYDELSGTREEFGDELYDWVLYASGRPNRIQVDSVIDGSPAASVGIEEGDVILAYADARVLSTSDLLERIREGRAGEATRVEVLRGDDTMSILIPRGPLGVRLRPARLAPAEAGAGR